MSRISCHSWQIVASWFLGIVAIACLHGAVSSSALENPCQAPAGVSQEPCFSSEYTAFMMRNELRWRNLSGIMYEVAWQMYSTRRLAVCTHELAWGMH